MAYIRRMKIHPSVLVLLWRRKLSIILLSSALILLALWSWAIYNTANSSIGEKFILIKDYNPTQTKQEFFLQRLISQANQILRYQRKQNFGGVDLVNLDQTKTPSPVAPIMENNPYQEEHLRILQDQQKINQPAEQPDDVDINYDQILTSAERQGQYERELQRMGVPIIPGLGPGGPRPPHERLIHLDLKGAPPKLSFLKRLLPILKTIGATGLLIEYEDMFPYTGSLQSLAAKNAYKPEELKDFLESVIQNGLSVMPLVQTFGHLEYALKLDGFEQMREIVESPQSICPSNTQSLRFLEDMITQIVEFHMDLNRNSSLSGNRSSLLLSPSTVAASSNTNLNINTNFKNNVNTTISHNNNDENGGVSSPRRQRLSTPQYFTHIHIGCDEVFRMAECDKCRLKSRNELFLSHITSLGSFIKTKWPALVPVIWDDMLRDITLSEMQHSQIGLYVEPMIWVYVNDLYHYIPPQLWDIYSKIFPTAWAASAFKGAFGENLMIPPIQRHLENNLRWLAVIAKEGERFSKGFRGITLTGWQRYDHFAVLCELLPTGLPSLLTCLSATSKGYFATDAKDNEIMNVLDCANRPDYRRSGHAWLELQAGSKHKHQLYSSCSYPGSSTYKFMLRLSEKLTEIDAYLQHVRRKSAWMSEYNIRHNFSSPLRVQELTNNNQNFIDQLVNMAKESQTVMAEIYDEYTISEYIEQHIYPTIRELRQHLEEARKLLTIKTWPRRPLPYAKELANMNIVTANNDANNIQQN
ncbi:hexosaminidase D [Condylostylus longicornis]|uniref:hexosaminidase D n=1 Tax=Condylostylus longicornis TaxID=2530218 RepID=UPI00244E249C|nr:hexosaminidase D [Condylostylus longicornis]XP_055387610.1 hexosaminidase D [Condylostylus longicornis]XP_055387611.1 hexosaminidase D [Condylostylus longicornis]XP_055387612.1 hexosaminidase D [Condylostylus longicornis]